LRIGSDLVMAGDGAATHGEAASSVPLQPCCSWSAAGVVGVGEGQMLKATGEDGCTTKRKQAAEKPCDSMAVDGGCDDDDDDWVYIGRDENSNLVVGDLVIDKQDPELLEHRPPGLDENGDLIMDKELLEHLEWVKTLDIPNLRDDPRVTFWSDVYRDDDESEEEGEEVVQKPNTI